MGSKHVLPSLTSQGWLKQSISVFDQMLGEFFLSEYSQTFCFTGGVSSFPWILQQYKGDMEVITERTKAALVTYLLTQFTKVDVEVSYKLEKDSISRYSLSLYIEITGSDGETINLTRLVNHSDTRVSEILKTLSTG